MSVLQILKDNVDRCVVVEGTPMQPEYIFAPTDAVLDMVWQHLLSLEPNISTHVYDALDDGDDTASLLEKYVSNGYLADALDLREHCQARFRNYALHFAEHWESEVIEFFESMY